MQKKTATQKKKREVLFVKKKVNNYNKIIVHITFSLETVGRSLSARKSVHNYLHYKFSYLTTSVTKERKTPRKCDSILCKYNKKL